MPLTTFLICTRFRVLLFTFSVFWVHYETTPCSPLAMKKTTCSKMPYFMGMRDYPFFVFVSTTGVCNKMFSEFVPMSVV